SHYCGSCHYKYKEKLGEKACPFNSLYWDFLDRNREKLEKNHRMGMIYRVWDKNSTEKKNQIIEQAAKYLNKMEEI
ncbi:MAG: cryptochrome/photolyase family protein, partial [Roseivirga sp.]|nr:cryptochrome/photolyase family protein [Roseivirga sp.]